MPSSWSAFLPGTAKRGAVPLSAGQSMPPFHNCWRRIPGQTLCFLEHLLILFYLRLYEGLELHIGGLEQVI